MDQFERINARMRVLLLGQAAGFFAWQAGGGVSNSDQKWLRIEDVYEGFAFPA